MQQCTRLKEEGVVTIGYSTFCNVYREAFPLEYAATRSARKQGETAAPALAKLQPEPQNKVRKPLLPNNGLNCEHLAANSVGGKVLAPSFTPAKKERGATDWYDLKQIRGEKGLLTALRDSFVQMQREHARSLGKHKGFGHELEMSR